MSFVNETFVAVVIVSLKLILTSKHIYNTVFSFSNSRTFSMRLPQCFSV